MKRLCGDFFCSNHATTISLSSSNQVEEEDMGEALPPKAGDCQVALECDEDAGRPLLGFLDFLIATGEYGIFQWKSHTSKQINQNNSIYPSELSKFRSPLLIDN